MANGTPNTIRPGDTVQLKSGGPPMTVVQVGPAPTPAGGPDWALCWWFADDRTLMKDTGFPLFALKPWVTA
jgi:uncharacterized protein YodC (DUF2158 family)